MSQHLDHFWAVIPAGGAGTRLWPLSRSSSPKFLHDLTGSGRTLLQATYDRLAPLTGERMMVVTGRVHRAAVVEQLPGVDPDHVIAEPSARDSMAAIGLAAALLEKRDPQAVMGSFAADHVVADDQEFASVVSRAVEVAQDGHLVTIGITPTGPATGFGYIEVGAALAQEGAFAAAAFVEKPDAATAAAYVAQGHLWNAGMFVVRPGVLLDLLADSDPGFAAMLRAVAQDPVLLGRDWPKMPRIALDHAVAEPAAAAGRVAVVPGSFGWDDVGDFASLLANLHGADSQRGGASAGVRVLGDRARVRAIDSEGLVVAAGDRLVAVVGLDDVVVVDTPDAVLVTTRARAQEVKQVVEALQRDGRDDLT